MHLSQGRSVFIAGTLLAAVAAAALAGGQERDASRGQEVPPTFGAKVVTEHVPVLPLPHLWRRPAKEAKKEEHVATRMGFRHEEPNEKPAIHVRASGWLTIT